MVNMDRIKKIMCENWLRNFHLAFPTEEEKAQCLQILDEIGLGTTRPYTSVEVFKDETSWTFVYERNGAEVHSVEIQLTKEDGDKWFPILIKERRVF